MRGYAAEKYTREYFTGRAADGTRLSYGALGADEWALGGISVKHQEMVALAEWAGKDVLEIGYGRGEVAAYLIRHGVGSYTGVDFAPAAYDLAEATVKRSNRGELGEKCRLVCQDALTFLETQPENAFDVAYLLDVVEHIPAAAMRECWKHLYRVLRPFGYLVIETPAYSVDEDLVAQGGRYIAPTATDAIPETSGMHCNKFTTERLFNEVMRAGFVCQKSLALWLAVKEDRGQLTK